MKAYLQATTVKQQEDVLPSQPSHLNLVRDTEADATEQDNYIQDT